MFFNSQNSSILAVFEERKEAGVYVYIPPPPTPFLGEWIGLAEQTEIITVINLSKQASFLFAEKESLICRAEIEQLNTTIIDLSKQSILLEKKAINGFYDSQRVKFSFTVIGGMHSYIDYG